MGYKNPNDSRQAYQMQKYNAKAKGIEWQFTFESWLAWWGDDLANRGKRSWNLQMQRFHDKGPYAPDNVRKGTPKRNAQTLVLRNLTAKALRAKAEIEAARDNGPAVESKDWIDEDEDELEHMFGVRSSMKKWR